jgi:exopolysaccharide production protein ExoQ
MKVHKKILIILEIAVVVILLLSAESLNLPPFMQAINNTGSYIILIFLLIINFHKIAYTLAQNKTLILLVSIAFASLLWSEVPSETFEQLRGLARTTIFGAYLAARYTIKDQMNLLAWAIGIAGILSFAVCILNPSYGIATTNGVVTWQGIYNFKQYLGRVMALGASVYLITILRKGKNLWFGIAGLILAFALIVLSASKTALIMLIFSILLLPVYKVIRQKANVRVIFILAILVIGASILSLIINNLESIVVDVLGKDLELNGRSSIWTLAIDKAIERPWLGYGYVAFWKSDAGQYIIRNTWGALVDSSNGWHAHNGFLEMILQLGLVGCTILIFEICFSFYKIIILLIKTEKFEYFWLLQFLSITIIWNLSEVITFLSASNIFWIIYVSVSLTASLEYKRLKKYYIK